MLSGDGVAPVLLRGKRGDDEHHARHDKGEP
jgi:hypothetical protein